MMAYKPKFSMIVFDKFKYDSIRDVNAKTPNLMIFWAQFFCAQRCMKGVVFEQVRFFYGFLLNRFWKCLEKFVKSCSGSDIHLVFLKKLGKGLSFCNAAFFMIFFRIVEDVNKLFTVKPCCITERFKIIFTYFNMDFIRRLFCYCGFKFRFHDNLLKI